MIESAGLQGNLSGEEVHMRQRERERSAGQVSGEYAIVLGAIALVCMVALFAIGIAVRGQLGSPDPGATPQQPFTPPAHPAPTRVPTTIEECEHDGWRTFGFRSEADCKDYVTGHAP
jgi:hypothetical protein